MTLGPCINHQPIHRFGVGWVCSRCGVPTGPAARPQLSPEDSAPVHLPTGDASATTDEAAGMEWWNALTEKERAMWLERAGTAVPADAWTEYRRSVARPAGEGGYDALILAFEDFLNEPSEFEERYRVREYRHHAYARWQPVLKAITALQSQLSAALKRAETAERANMLLAQQDKDSRARAQQAEFCAETAEKERDEAVNWTETVERHGTDQFDDLAEAWLNLDAIKRVTNAVTSTFAKWANDDLMARFRQHQLSMFHMAFVEGALAGVKASESRADALAQDVARLTGRVDAAREFVKRHPALSQIDQSEFEAFLKVSDALTNQISEIVIGDGGGGGDDGGGHSK